jgi:hypothetical protein
MPKTEALKQNRDPTAVVTRRELLPNDSKRNRKREFAADFKQILARRLSIVQTFAMMDMALPLFRPQITI